MESDKPVLIDFFAPWCGPCRMLSPIIDEIAQEADSFKVAKVNVDEQPELAQAFGVMSIPTLVVHERRKGCRQGGRRTSKAAIMGDGRTAIIGLTCRHGSWRNNR
jgi:thioredoxin 1